MKDSKDLSSNAYASFLYVRGPNPSRFTLMITVFIAMRKVHCRGPFTNAAHCRVTCPLLSLHSHNILAAHNRAMLRARRLRRSSCRAPQSKHVINLGRGTCDARPSPASGEFLIATMAFTSVHNQEDQSYLIAFRSLLGTCMCANVQAPRLPASLRRRPTWCTRFARARSACAVLPATSRSRDSHSIAVPLIGAVLGGAGGWVEGSQLSPAVLARRVSDSRLDVVRVRISSGV